ncbi:MAG: ABC transporter permease [Alphaproteobacteria bacterium]
MRLRPATRSELALLGLTGPAVAFALVFFLAPLALLLGYSFLGYANGEIVARATLAQYAALLGDPLYQRIVGRTLLVALATTALCMLLGYPVALGIVRAEQHKRPLLLTLVLTPLLIGGVVRSYGWILILDERGLLNRALLGAGLIEHPLQLLFNFAGVVAAMVEVLIPFFILPLMGSLSRIDPLLESASRGLGASRLQTFLSVTLPLSLAGVAAGGVIVFSLALNIFVVPRIIGGPRFLVLATLAYQQVGEVGNLPFGSAVAGLMLVLTLSSVALVNRTLLARYRHLGVA